jgi:exodeoxyribonuclease VII small subunit
MATEKLTYAKAMVELEEIVTKMEANQFEIDELTDKVKRVAVLAKFCKEKLHKTEEEVSKILEEIGE